MRFVFILAAILALPAFALADADSELSDNAQIKTIFGQLPLYFIENQGQIDKDDVAYYVKGADKTLYFTSEGITFVLTGKEGDKTKRWIVKLEFAYSNPDVRPRGEDKQEAVFSYFKGKEENWRTGLATYRCIVYEDLWPDIDLIYKGTVNQLKYEFVVKPGADPSLIQLAYDGASSLSINDQGSLNIRTPACTFKDEAPYAYQMIDGLKKEVSVKYQLEEGGNSFSFAIGEYNTQKQLILDPAMLVYCGYIGGSGSDWNPSRDGIAVDTQGNAYVAGETNSSHTSFPVSVGPDLTHNGDYDVFVAKVNAQGTGLVYCGYIGGDDIEYGNGISLDSQGNAYVTGTTSSDESTFPVTVGPDLTFNSPGPYDTDAFVAKVNAQGTGLVYCGYIGGEGNDYGNGIDVDDHGNAYVTGETQGFLPVKVGPDLTANGGDEAFVAKVNSQGADLGYCGYIGGIDDERGFSIAVDASGNAYVTGRTKSDESSFPVVLGPDLTHNGGWDAYVARVNAQGTHLDFCGYIGGNGSDQGFGISVDNQQRAYVCGKTASDETSFSVKVGPDLTHNGGDDAFVARVNTQGSDFDYCGYIGGALGENGARGIAVDGQYNAYVTGSTSSDESSFPMIIGPDLTHNGGNDAYVARINSSGTGLDYCGYIGGTAGESGQGITVDNQGNVYLFGNTDSDQSSFPVVDGPDLTHNSPGTANDAFVAKVMHLSLMADVYELPESTGGTINYTLDAGVWNANRNYLLLGSITGDEPGTPLPGGHVILPLNWDLFTNVIIGMLNGPVFTNFQGTLDGQGNGTAQLNLPPVPGTAGLTMHFAYALNNPWNFVSNPVGIEIVP